MCLLIHSPPSGMEPGSWNSQIGALGAGDSAGAWNLPRAQVASDLQAMLEAPDSVDQGAFGFCGIAAFLRFWSQRRPGAVARFARAVYEHGSAAFGSYHVSPRLSLRRYDYMAAYATGRTRCPPGQWMLMGAIQDSISPAGFDGSVDASWTAFLSLHEGANPHQIATLLRDTGMYAQVDTRVDWEAVVMPRLPFAPDPWRPSLADAEALAPGPACDVILDINDGFLPGASPAPKGIVGDLERDQPNHFVALVSPLAVSGETIRGRIWTWAGVRDLELPAAQFMSSYYGAIVGVVAPAGA
jgi:hypothetical protein